MCYRPRLIEANEGAGFACVLTYPDVLIIKDCYQFVLRGPFPRSEILAVARVSTY